MDQRLIKWVPQAEMLKIAGLVAVLITLPLTISLFRIPSLHTENIPDVTLGYLLIRLLFVFTLSYLVLQLNANSKYRWYQLPKFLGNTLTVLGNLAIYLLAVNALLLLYPVLADRAPTQEETGFIYFIFGVVHIIMIFIARILRLGIIRRESLLENEKLQQQNLQKELTALRNQLDPHFLFNSLNTLTALVRDNEVAATFVSKLSHMYRYILQSGDRDTVCVKDELKFLESYTYLIRTRYRDLCFKVDIKIDPSHLNMMIPPMALQLLMENAVKHNEISKGCPLLVSIYSEGDKIVVVNKLRPRATPVDSMGNGLFNLDKRYELLRKQHISIRKDEDEFSVKLPLIPSA